MIGPEHENPQPASGAGFGDAVTFSFGDPEQELFGTARLGLAGEPPATASALALLFDGREPVALAAAGGEPVEAPDWAALEAGGLRTETIEPLRSWRAAFSGEEGGFDLRFEALCPPLEFGAASAAARAAGVEGYEQLCRVRGTVSAGGSERPVECLGQRGHQWGAPDWSAIAASRTISAWLGPDAAVLAAAVRPQETDGHEDEALSAYLLEPGPEGPLAVPVGEPLLSTTYDGEGRQRRAGLELWVGEDDEFARRLAGEAICGTTLELGRLALECSFFRWRMEGREGVGRYDVLRRR